MKVIVIGGGPAGMMAGIAAKERKTEEQVCIIERNNMLGKKLLITGKGRCNITSSLPMESFIKNIPGNGNFLYSAFHQYTNQDILEFLRKQGLQVKEERGNRVFPVTDQSKDVLYCFKKRLQQLAIPIYYDTIAKKILLDGKKVIGVEVEQKGEIRQLPADKVIVATGGKSYPLTGSTGEGYNLVKELGHTITNLQPSLVPLETENKKMVKELQGLSLKNVAIQIVDKRHQKMIYQDFGEMLFTHFGVSGPTILSASAHLLRYPEVQQCMTEGNMILQIDLKPGLEEEKLDNRIRRDFEQEKNKKFKNALFSLLPQKLIPVIVEISGILPEKQVNEITKEERKELVKLLKNFTLTIQKPRPIEEAIITSGGVSVKEINPKTMESKLISGLFLAGEIIDVDAYTGGFNLQIAYSTGYCAGKGEVSGV